VTEVHQFLATLAGRDAIGMHTLRMRALLRDAGFASDIYALETHDEVRGEAKDPLTFSSRPRADRDCWILYHFSIGSKLTDIVRAIDAPLALDYHNITEAKYFWRWEPRAAAQMLDGRRQLALIAPEAAFAIADSAFNEAEVAALGCPRTAVAPILIDFHDYEASPDGEMLGRRRRARDTGGTDWLAVGRIAPNKCQHDVIAAFAVFRRLHDPSARLTLIGGQSAGLYWRELHRLAADLGIADAVRFTDVVSHAELLACYRTADVFVCLSEHEGFNVPVLEAMYFGVPVVAYAAAAVPGTVGTAGLLLTGKDPLTVATAVERVRSDTPLRSRLVTAGHERVEHFSIARTGPLLIDTLTTLIKQSS
jgi:glycosyltransferase involved in cell wall biosynthesis